MAKRHQSRRRRAYGPRQHELRERRARRREDDVRRRLELALTDGSHPATLTMARGEAGSFAGGLR